MWEEDKFIFRLIPDPNHYLAWLSFGLLFFFLSEKSGIFDRVKMRLNVTLVSSLLVSFLFSLYFDAIGFLLALSLAVAFFSSLQSSIAAVCTTVILYICRPWEVVETNDWWMQLPRWCIWLWFLSWLRERINHKIESFAYLKMTPGIWLIGTMAVWAFLTSFLSRDSAGSIQYYIDTLMRAIILVLIIQLTVRCEEDAKKIQTAFAVGVATLSIFSLWRFQGFDQHAPLDIVPRMLNQSDRRLEAVGSLGNSNDIAAVVLIPLGILWPKLFAKKSQLHIRIFSLIIIYFLIKAILASQSRGALIAGVAQCGIYFLSQSRSPARFGTLLLIAVSLVAPLANQVMGRNADDLDASTESRMNYYVTGLRMALYSPIWGQGFGRYPYEFERYSSATLHEWGHRTAHSSWVLVVSETGFVGLAIFTMIHARMFRQCWQLRNIEPGLLLALSGYSITILFLSHSWLMFPWILFVLIELRRKFTTAGVSDEKTVLQL